ncbi:MAG TPA: 2-aminoethylphosphonate aminotransferase [Steroidobacteraceae bacterium]|nr:2-aminoethylphosphonate aminotransferase [Steroidobacteraceae bacterium]
MILLNPGPVTLSERVRRSLLNPDLCHREAEFFDLQEELRAGLLAVHDLDPAHWSAVLMTGSGTAAVDSMMASLPHQDARVLILANGVYGERIAQMCAQYRIAHESLTGAWLDAPDLSAVAARLASGAFTHLGAVHHETTTGRLTDIAAINALCNAQGVQLLLDGVSSFGAEAIDFAATSLAAVAATANKCLHGVPGVSFVITRRSALARAVNRTYYLDLARLARLQDERNTPFTPAVQAYYGLREALREYREQGGRAARFARFAALAEQVRAGLAQLGIEALLSPEESSVVLRAYHLPRGISYPTLHDGLKADGFVIYAGQGDLSRTLFRISTMGEIGPDDVRRLLESFRRIIR